MEEQNDREEYDEDLPTMFVTGMTTDEFEEKVRADELLADMGEEGSGWERCYLCKRREGEQAVYLELEKGELQMGTSDMIFYDLPVMQEGEKKVRVYRVCEDCFVLLNAVASGNQEEEEEGPPV